MKKTSIILMAFALIAMMAQCKKDNNGQATPDNSENAVAITLSVDGDGSKAHVDTWTGEVGFDNGDKIYVGSGGKYVGSLTRYNDSYFAGNISNAVEGEPLQFYFLGNVDPEEVIVAGSTEEFSVVISDQTDQWHMPVISCAPSNESYSLTTTDYTAHLLNKCALAKFLVTTPANDPVCVTGFNNKVTVDFTTNTLTPSQDGEGVIMLPAGYGESVEKWAILLPQEAVEAGGEGSAYSLGGNYSGTRPALPEILENAYLGDGIAIAVDNMVFPQGAINAQFTINAAGEKVFFSQGNLQYDKTTGEWSFMEHQYDIVETYNQNVGEGYANQNTVSLFGWGTSGYDHGANAFQPWSTSTGLYDYSAYGVTSYNLYSETGAADWGINSIANGGNQENFGWRTLTSAEWSYIYYSRPNASYKWGCGKVDEVNGLILLPDEWTLPEGLVSFISSTVNWNNNIYTSSQWARMEANGAVFLPAAGNRYGSSVQTSVNSAGYYWSSSSAGSNYAYSITFNNSVVNPQNYNNQRYYGCSVRLVRDAQ